MIKTSKWSLTEKADSPVENALFLVNEEGQDWYEFQEEFKRPTYKVEYTESGDIVKVTKDVSELFPQNNFVVEVGSIPEDIMIGNYVYNGKRLVKKKISAEEITLRTELKIEKILQSKGSVISSLSALVNAGLADDKTKEKLALYTTYLKQVIEVDRLKPEWPEEPQV